MQRWNDSESSEMEDKMDTSFDWLKQSHGKNGHLVGLGTSLDNWLMRAGPPPSHASSVHFHHVLSKNQIAAIFKINQIWSKKKLF